MWELDYKESWVLKNWCFWTVVLEKTHESSLECKEISPVNPKGNQSWIFVGDWRWSWNSNTLATWLEKLTHWKRPWCWERLKVRGEGDDRGWDGWMASPTQWTWWIWISSGNWWWTGKPGILQSMGSWRVRQGWATELNCVLGLPKIPNYSFPLANTDHFLSLWVSFCFVSRFICIISFQIPHIKDAMWYFSFSVWLTSLSMLLSRSLYVAANGIISFF